MEKSLSNGLMLRSFSAGYPQDRERLRGLYHLVFKDELGDWNVPEDDVWVGKLLSGGHPTITDDDVWVVVDPAKDDMVVSSVLLIPQMWRYEHVEIGVGRPEVVLTHPDYRRRGLIRELMTVVHERSESLGHIVQAITGIGHYYRRFGYGMAVDLGDVAAIPMTAVPELKDGETPRYTLRPVDESDLPRLQAWDEQIASQYALSVVRTPDSWQHFMSFPGTALMVIVDENRHTDVGYVALRQHTRSHRLRCHRYVIGDRSSYLMTYGDVLRGIKTYAETASGEGDSLLYINFHAGAPPVLQTLLERSSMVNRQRHMYAWYLRAASPARLMQTIKPVLEQRLVNSGENRYTGELTLDFYDLTGLRMRFEDGCLVAAEDIEVVAPKDQDSADARFPYDSFLSLVFGHRNLRDLSRVLPETYASGRAEALLDTLFPVKPSSLVAL